MLDLGKLGISGKLAMSTFQWHKSCIILSSDCETVGFGIRVARSDFLVGGPFSGVDSGQLGDALDEPRQPASR
jgi:hypothetical protein